MIIKQSLKLASVPLIAGVLIYFSFNGLSEGEHIDFTANNYLRHAYEGVNLLLILASIKFIFDFYLIYIKRAHVEISDEGVLDKSSLTSESFYEWDEIINLNVVKGLLCEGLMVVYRTQVISENPQYSSSEIVVIKELDISKSDKLKIHAYFKKHTKIMRK